MQFDSRNHQNLLLIFLTMALLLIYNTDTLTTQTQCITLVGDSSLISPRTIRFLFCFFTCLEKSNHKKQSSYMRQLMNFPSAVATSNGIHRFALSIKRDNDEHLNSPWFLEGSCYSALIFSVVLSVLCLSFVSFCWLWFCLSSDLTISVCPFGIFQFLLYKTREICKYWLIVASIHLQI